MNTKKYITVGVALLAILKAVAADSGGTPGFVKAVFFGERDYFYLQANDIESNAIGYTLVPEEMYSSTTIPNTTIAWSGYMKMTGGEVYRFACLNDKSIYRHPNDVILRIFSEHEHEYVQINADCHRNHSIEFVPPETDWYRVVLLRHQVEDLDTYYAEESGELELGMGWSIDGGVSWNKMFDCGDGSLFKTGKMGLRNVQKQSMPVIVSSKMRKEDKTIMDIAYAVISPKTTANVRALAFQDGKRLFGKLVRPKTFVADEDGNSTAGNIGDGVPANKLLKLAWRVPSDWDIDIAKVKFEILTSEAAQLPLRTLTIPATAKNESMTVAYNSQGAFDIYNALLWWYACEDEQLVCDNRSVYLNGDRICDSDRFLFDTFTLHRILEWLYGKIGWEPLAGGNLLDYVRKATRKDIWFNQFTQTCAIRKADKPTSLYVGDKAYCVIDVSGGPNAESYPISYLDTEPVNGWSDEYKTTKILLRRVEPVQYNETVTITRPYYIGVFMLTQKQYEQVMGSGMNPTKSDHRGDLRPVEISWNAIRGDSSTYNWPMVTTVDPATFVGKIQTKTGLKFDLPTEVQWLWACGALSDPGFSTPLVSPNLRGLYDMNVNYDDQNDELSAIWMLDSFPFNVNERRICFFTPSRENTVSASYYYKYSDPSRDNGVGLRLSGIVED